MHEYAVTSVELSEGRWRSAVSKPGAIMSEAVSAILPTKEESLESLIHLLVHQLHNSDELATSYMRQVRDAQSKLHQARAAAMVETAADAKVNEALEKLARKVSRAWRTYEAEVKRLPERER